MLRSARSITLPIALSLTCLFSLAGCATFSENFATVEHRLAAQDVAGALAAVERVDFPARDRALFLLNKGMLQRMAGDLRGSGASFEAAKGLLDEFARLSLREQSLSLAVNDAARAYEGQPFEQMLLHVFAALNYLELGDLNGARVEILQLDLRLRALVEDDEKLLPQTAFARYFSGLVFEAGGERADAMIAYRKALEAYVARVANAASASSGNGGKNGGKNGNKNGNKNDERAGTADDDLLRDASVRDAVPPQLQQDLLRLSAALGLDDEHRRYRRAFGEPGGPIAPRSELGEVVLIFHNGLAPGLREQSATVLDPSSGHFVRIALPTLMPRALPVAGVALTAGGIREASQVVEDVEALAQRSLAARLPGMTARLLARQVVKRQVSRQASLAANKQGNSAGEQLGAGLVALGVELTNLFTERADTRSWATLPANIQLVRLPLPPGRYVLQIDHLDASGRRVAEQAVPELDLVAGAMRFLSVHRAAGLPLPSP